MMKKITDFIIDKRYLILCIFILLTGVSLYFSNSVKINYDISKYLPDTSKTRIGMDKMEEAFKGIDECSLNIMFKDLKAKEKETIKEELEGIEHVKKVDYDKTEDYNKGNNTLYVLTIEGKEDGSIAKKVYNTIIKKYQDYEFYTSGEVDECNKTVLSIWIVALAVFCALIILIIMCSSYVEPFLFLITILMAVVLNKGTNIFFPSISHITNSISAILQMALSMDYSIMLMNRYDQEKKKTPDKVVAMKQALHQAFQSISSSSITTIVGLLALVFMSFKIGKDLGFILAKGVLFSLICIFFVLPALILMFDKQIEKTKKKSPALKLTFLGKMSYRFRFLSLPLLLLVFVGSFLLKGNLKIDYTDRQSDEISKVFQENNQMAIVYDNKEEEKVRKYLDKLEQDEDFKEVLGYGNTIDEHLTYKDLKQQLKDLGSNVEVDDYLLKIIYYNYYNQDETQTKMTFEQFIDFIEQEALTNPKTSKEIDEATRQDITRLKNFVLTNERTRARNQEEFSKLLEIDNDSQEELMIYYLSLNHDTKLSLKSFIEFINHNVLTNEKYAGRISKEARGQIERLSPFLVEEQLTEAKDFSSMAKFFGLDEELVRQIYRYYVSLNFEEPTLTIQDFSSFVLETVAKNPSYQSLLDAKTQTQMELLSTFSNVKTIQREMTTSEISTLFEMSEEKVKELLLLKELEQENTNTHTVMDFLNGLLEVQEKTTYLEDFDTTLLEELKQNQTLLSDTTEYDYTSLADLLNLDRKQINQLYHFIDLVRGQLSLQTTPSQFVNDLLTLETNKFIELDDATVLKLQFLEKIMTATENNQSFSAKDLSAFLEADEVTFEKIYTLYKTMNNTTVLTPLEFIDFILDNKDASVFQNALTGSMLKELTWVRTIITSVLENQKYDSASLANLLGLDRESVQLLYGLYCYQYRSTEKFASLEEFVDFLLNTVATNEAYQDRFTPNKLSKLQTAQAIMNASQNHVRYTSNEIYAILSTLSNTVEKNLIDVLYTYYGSTQDYHEEWTMTVQEFVTYLNQTILKDERYQDFIDGTMRKDITDAKKTVSDAKKQLVGKEYSRIVLNTNLNVESKRLFKKIDTLEKLLKKEMQEFYIIGNSPMANEMQKTFNNELNLITIITMLAIFIVVALTFKSLIIPLILVFIIQCAVYLTMGILTVTGDNVYFIALLIVQSILMGATIDYAILYTSYYLEHRKSMSIKDAVISSYKQSAHTIFTSSSILIIVTLIIACFTSAIASKICKTISEGTICSTILILVLLPAILACCDKIFIKKRRKEL